jgi:hypothetical protein
MTEREDVLESLASSQGRVLGAYMAAAMFVLRRAAHGDEGRGHTPDESSRCGLPSDGGPPRSRLEVHRAPGRGLPAPGRNTCGGLGGTGQRDVVVSGGLTAGHLRGDRCRGNRVSCIRPAPAERSCRPAHSNSAGNATSGSDEAVRFRNG